MSAFCRVLPVSTHDTRSSLCRARPQCSLHLGTMQACVGANLHVQAPQRVLVLPVLLVQLKAHHLYHLVSRVVQHERRLCGRALAWQRGPAVHRSGGHLDARRDAAPAA